MRLLSELSKRVVGCALVCALFLGACGDDAAGPGTSGTIEGVAILAGATDHGGILISLDQAGGTSTTAPDGSYRITNVPPGTYVISASRAGYGTAASDPVAAQAGQVTVAPELTLQPVQGTMSGYARLEGQTDHSGIVLVLGGTGQEAETSADGSYIFTGVAPGTYVVQASRPGFDGATSAPVTMPAEGGDLTVPALLLEMARGNLEGVATLEGELEHGGILVVLQGTSHATLTGPTGSYAFSGVPAGQYTVVASYPSFTTATATDQVVVGNQTTHVPALLLSANPGRVTGVALLEGQTLHSGILVRLDNTSLEAVTDSGGQYAIDAIPAGYYTVTAVRAGYADQTSSVFQVQPGQTVSLPTLFLSLGRGAVEGTMELEGESDHGGALVEVVGTSRAGVSNAAGEYYISDVPVGTWEVRVSMPTFVTASAPSVTVQAQQTTTVGHLVLGANPGTLVGVVLKEGATDHTGVLVTVNNTPHSGSTDASGAFTITGVQEGVYSVSASAEGFERYDYPLVVVSAGQTVDLGQATLEKAKGYIRGWVTVEGKSSFVGVRVDLLGSSFFTSTAFDGSWELQVPVGNYDGVRASLAHYAPAEALGTITVTTSGIANVPTLHLVAVDNALHGRVTLFGETDHSGVTVELFGIAGEATEGEYHVLVTVDPTGFFTFASVLLGPYHIRYSYQAGWGTITRYIEVLAGDAPTLPTEELKEQFIFINGDAEWTNTAAVTLTLGSSDCYQMKLSNLPDLAGASWEACAPSKAWTLAGPDGTNTVYVQYMDSQLVESSVLLDAIWLDMTATILWVSEDTGGAPQARNDVIHFALHASDETAGTARVDIVGYQAGIALYDDGTHGDPTAGDGLYERDFAITASTDVNGATVTGRFTDRYGNLATPVNAPGTVTIAIPPVILNVQVVADSQTGTATISWQTDEPASGLLNWGTDQFYGNTQSNAAYTYGHSFGLTGLLPSTEYHFRATATDPSGNFSMTVDRTFFLRPNPPELVVAMCGNARCHVRWEAPTQENVVGYYVYRSNSPGGPYTVLDGEAYDHEALMYPDLTVSNGQPYFYVVTAEDEHGNESELSQEASGTPGAGSGPTSVTGALVGDQVWTTQGSPYLITGNTMVQAGQFLAVGPGTEVRFTPGTTLIVYGQLIVIGDGTDIVALTSNAVTPATGDWGGIQLKNTSIGARVVNRRYRGGTIFAGTRLEYAGTAITTEGRDLCLLDGEVAYSTRAVSSSVATQWTYMTRPHIHHVGSVIYMTKANLWLSDGDIHDVSGIAIYSDASMSCGEPRDRFVTVERSELYRVGSFVIAGEADEASCGLGFYPKTTIRVGVSESSFHENNNMVFQLLKGDGYISGSIKSSRIETSCLSSGQSPVRCEPSGACSIVDSIVAGNLCSYAVNGSNVYSSDIHHAAGPAVSGGTVVSSDVLCEGTTSCVSGASIHSSVIQALGVCQAVLSGPGDSTYNHIHGDLCGQLVNGAPGLLQYNSFLSEPSGYMYYYTAGFGTDRQATFNYWGPTVTAEMDSLGPNANISAIFDFYDDIARGKALYSNWVSSAYPMARITAPLWGSQFRLGETVGLLGEADDPEDGPIPGASLAWESSLGGPLGVGALLEVSTLAKGHHQIWLTATDSNSQQGKVWVEIDVVE